jgi:hypothetical protein
MAIQAIESEQAPAEPLRGAVAPGSFRLNEAVWEHFVVDRELDGAPVEEPTGEAVERLLHDVSAYRYDGGGVIDCPGGFDLGWLSASCASGTVRVELGASGGGHDVVSDRAVRIYDAAPFGAQRARRVLALIIAEANALLPTWRAARACAQAWHAAA